MSHMCRMLSFCRLKVRMKKMTDNELINKKWELRLQNQEKKYTCYYSPNEKHSLCPHPETCILNQEVAKVYGEIQQNKDKIKYLKKIYDDAIDHYMETNESMYVGFTPKNNTLERKILENKNRKNYQKLKELKTKSGGYA